MVIADLDFTLIDKRKQMMDSRGHFWFAEYRGNLFLLPRLCHPGDGQYDHFAPTVLICFSRLRC